MVFQIGRSLRNAEPALDAFGAGSRIFQSNLQHELRLDHPVLRGADLSKRRELRQLEFKFAKRFCSRLIGLCNDEPVCERHLLYRFDMRFELACCETSIHARHHTIQTKMA